MDQGFARAVRRPRKDGPVAMTELERQVAEDRALRDAARAVFEARRIQVEDALADRPVGTRVADEALDRARNLADDAGAIARENAAVVAGTGVLLAGWVFRKPLLKWAHALLRRDEPEELAGRWQRFQEHVKSIARKG